MSPIFIRPVREQLEHDRLIRHLQVKYKRKVDVAMNLGEEQAAPVKLGTMTVFPDLVITDGKKLAGLVEVESSESVNNLEAMAQWVPFSRAKAPFHLYVPVNAYDAARRLCEANGIHPAEVWTYRPLMEGFDLVRMSTSPGSRQGPPDGKATRAVQKAQESRNGVRKAAPRAARPEPPKKKTPASAARKPGAAKARPVKAAKARPARAKVKR